jgi:methylase of polypeptide subunit release factors
MGCGIPQGRSEWLVVAARQDRGSDGYLPAGDWLRVFEFGCGQGKQAIGLARSGYRVSSFDGSPVAITAARRNAEKAGVRALLPDAPEVA